MSHRSVTDNSPDPATVRAVLASAESALLLGGLARKGIAPRRGGPYTVPGAIEHAAGGDPVLIADAVAAVEAVSTVRNLDRWVASNPDLIEVGKALQTAMRHLSLAVAK